MAWGHLLSQICQSARGLVLEGKGLIPMLDTLTDQGMDDFPLDPDRLHNGAIRVYAVGCCNSSVESSTAALSAHGGWVIERGEDFLLDFSRRQHERNRKLRARAHAAAIPFFDIPRENFTEAVDRAVAEMVAELRLGNAH